MFRTLLVLGIAVLAIVFIAKDRQDHTAVKRIDAQLTLTVTQARRVAPYSLVAPAGLPSTWAPTSVSYTGHLLHIGYVTPSGKYADFEESDGDITPALAPFAGKDLKTLGTIPVGPRQATIQVASSSRVTLTETVGAVHIGVTGGASQAELQQLLASLG